MNSQQVTLLVYSVLLAIFLTLSACDLIEKTLDQEDMHVYFYKPDGTELYLGVVRGISLCRSTVLSKAKSFNFEGNGGMPPNTGIEEQILADETNKGGLGWTYHCCWKTTTSSCKQKLK